MSNGDSKVDQPPVIDEKACFAVFLWITPAFIDEARHQLAQSEAPIKGEIAIKWMDGAVKIFTFEEFKQRFLGLELPPTDIVTPSF